MLFRSIGGADAAFTASQRLATPNDDPSASPGIADPGVVTDPSTATFVSLSTGGRGQVWTSRNAAGPWVRQTRPALASYPGWAKAADPKDQQSIWAPAQIQLTSGPHAGTWVMFFSAVRVNGPTQKRCIGVAWSSSPTGPFTVQDDDAPLICPGGSLVQDPVPDAPNVREGVLDPTPRLLWVDGSQGLYLSYKTTGKPSSIQLVQLDIATGGTTTVGRSHQLIRYSGNQIGRAHV